MIQNFSYDQDFKNLMSNLSTEYGKEIMNLEGIGNALDINNTSKKYFKEKFTVNATVDQNANVDDNTVLGYMMEIPKPYFRLNSLYKMWETVRKLFGKDKANEVITAEVSGAIYTHDLVGYAVRSYCWAASMLDILNKGLPFIPRVKSIPAQHLTTFIQHINQTVMFMSNQLDGAVALPDLFVSISYFVEKDIRDGILPNPKTDYDRYLKEITQQFQILVYTLNQPVRGGQSPFTNISIFDRYFFAKLFGDITFPDGTKPDYDKVNDLQKIYCDMFTNELRKQVLTFPIPTAAIAVEEIVNPDGTKARKAMDPEFMDQIIQYNLEYGHFNIYTGEITALSSCCRLKNEIDNDQMKEATELSLKNMNDNSLSKEYINTFGATSALKIGSHRVVTVNLPRIALMSSDEKTMIDNLTHHLSLAQMVLEAHRYIIRDVINTGKLPLYKFGLMDLNRQYSTFGFIGLYEMIHLMGENPTSEKGLEMMEQVISRFNTYAKGHDKIKEETSYIVEFRDGTFVKKVINSKVSILRMGKKESINISDLKYNDHYDGRTVKAVATQKDKIIYTYNVEQIPGESAAVKMLQKDRIIFKSPELNNIHLYSNQFVPLSDKMIIAERMTIHGTFDHKIGGGAILHINVAEKITEPSVMRTLVENAISKGVIYFAINYNFLECQNGHITVGKKTKCDQCGAPIIKEYTRVVGFITPKENWSNERRTEDRQWLKT